MSFRSTPMMNGKMIIPIDCPRGPLGGGCRIVSGLFHTHEKKYPCVPLDTMGGGLVGWLSLRLFVCGEEWVSSRISKL